MTQVRATDDDGGTAQTVLTPHAGPWRVTSQPFRNVAYGTARN